MSQAVPNSLEVSQDLLARWKQISKRLSTANNRNRSAEEDKATKFLSAMRSFGVLLVTSNMAFVHKDATDEEPRQTNPGTRKVKVIGCGQSEFAGIDGKLTRRFYIDAVVAPYRSNGYAGGMFWRYVVDELSALRYDSRH